MKLDLNGKVVLVTGADSVTGAAICRRFAENGAKVAAAGADEAAVKALAVSIDGAAAIAADVACKDGAAAMVKKTVELFGRLDVLVNAAVVPSTEADHKPLQDYDDELWLKVINTQMTGVFYASKPAAAQMVAQGEGGSIINVASAVGLEPIKMQVAYVAASAGVFNFTKAMALELGPKNIRVNAVAPGAIEGEAYIDGLVSHAAGRKAGRPEDVAAMVCMLADDSVSASVSGAVITVDGAYTAGYARDF